MMTKILLTLLLTLSIVCSKIIEPEVGLLISSQAGEFLLDINSPDSFIYEKHSTEYSENGLDVTNAMFKSLKTSFIQTFDSELNFNKTEISGTLIKINARTASKKTINKEFNGNIIIGLVNETTNDFTVGFRNNFAPRMGRIGLNPFKEGQTNFSKLIYGKDPKNFAYGVACDSEDFCTTSTRVGSCELDSVEEDKLIVPIKQNPDDLWQIEASGYSFGPIFTQKPVNVTFSTTTSDIVLPRLAFAAIAREVQATFDGTFYRISCDLKKKKHPDLVLKLTDNKKIVIPLIILFSDGSLHRDRCILRSKASSTNDVVLGLAFYQAFGTCFKGDSKDIQLQKITVEDGLHQ